MVYQRGISALILTVLIGLRPALGAQGDPPAPSSGDKCPVCGMFVAKFPDWIGVARFRTGPPVYADGAKDLFRYLENLGKYTPGRQKGDVVSIHLKDYYHLGWIDGRKAFFVIGSDVFGPMGRELVPFATEADAKAFLQEHHGTRMLRSEEITPELLRSLE